MKKLSDYGIRIISHGMWSDPEVEWKKSKYQKLLFNYWDCVETLREDFDLDNEDDLQEFLYNLYDLTPSEYDLPDCYYEWTVWTDSGDGLFDESLHDDVDYYKERKISPKTDFVLHTAGQALRQAVSYCFDEGIGNTEISVYRHDGERELAARYIMQGSTLKNVMSYKK